MAKAEEGGAVGGSCSQFEGSRPFGIGVAWLKQPSCQPPDCRIWEVYCEGPQVTPPSR